MKAMHLWIIGLILAFIAGGLFIGKVPLGNVLPFAIFLICPIMMIFMMKGHGKH